MQSVLMYGRLLTRALANSVFSYTTCTSTSDARYAWTKGDLGLQTATCGFPKERNRFSIGLGRGRFGDDACFAAKYKSFDVLGKQPRPKLSILNKNLRAVLATSLRCFYHS